MALRGISSCATLLGIVRDLNSCEYLIEIECNSLKLHRDGFRPPRLQFFFFFFLTFHLSHPNKKCTKNNIKSQILNHLKLLDCIIVIILKRAHCSQKPGKQVPGFF